MSAAAKSQKQAMYVVTKDERLWLLNVQRKLYAQSQKEPSYVFQKLWGLVTDPQNLRIAFARVNRNRGRRTAGVDRVTVRQVLHLGVDRFLEQLREELRSGAFRPRPAR